MVELVSLHVPKCAGSALLVALQEIYGEENFYLDYEDQILRPAAIVNIDPEGYVRYFKTLRDPLLAGKRVVHGHFYLQKYADLKDVLRITVLRDPVDRLISHYFYWKITPVKQGQPIRNYIENNNITIEEFARMPALRYFYTRGYFRDADMASFDLVASYEHIDKGMKKLGQLIGTPVVLKTENTNAFNNYNTLRDEIRSDAQVMANLRDSLRADVEFYEKYALS